MSSVEERAIVEALQRGRESFARREWMRAYEALSGIDPRASLSAEDLELLATAAYMIGRDEDYVRALERAHHAHLEAGESLRAVRSAFWLGLGLMLRRETARDGVVRSRPPPARTGSG
jgi:hypothetical protein